jgi:hypothetical protein
MDRADLEWAGQAVFRVTILDQQPIEFFDFLGEMDFGRGSFNIVNRNLHSSSCLGRTIYYETGEKATRMPNESTLDHRNWISYEKGPRWLKKESK